MRQWTVRDVMTNQVLTVTAGAAPAEMVSLMIEHDVSALAVADEHDVVIGVLTRSDVLRALDRHPEPRWRRRTARQMMSAPPVTIAPDATLVEAGRLMHREGVKRLLVVDHRRHLLGVVAAADLLKAVGRPEKPAATVAPAPAPRPREPWWPARRRGRRGAERVPSAVH